MPSRNEIFDRISRTKKLAQDDVRREYLAALSAHTGRDTLLYASAFSTRKNLDIPASLMSVTSDDVSSFMSALHGMQRDRLDLILHSPGGSLEVAEQIVIYLRAKYRHIRAIVPQNAMSAATMIACACDEIVLGRHSAIGPIDPQITMMTDSGPFTSPAQAILDEFNEARQEISADPRAIPLWVPRLQRLPTGFLRICQTAVDLSKSKVKGWLEQYMFAADNDRERKATEISNWLGDANAHRTHGRPIMMDDARLIGLKVVELEGDQQLQDLALSVFHASLMTFQVTNCIKIVENHNGKGSYLNVEVSHAFAPMLPSPSGPAPVAAPPRQGPSPADIERKVREVAHRVWQLRGCPTGTELEDWVEAKRILGLP